MNGKISNEIYKTLVDGITDYEWATNVFYEMPSNQRLVDEGTGSFFICKERITIEHDCEKEEWTIISWGE